MLDDARAISETVLNTVRDMSHLLHPSLLDDLGLAAAVDSYLKASPGVRAFVSIWSQNE